MHTHQLGKQALTAKLWKPKSMGQVAKNLVDARKRRLAQQWETLRNQEVHSYPFKHSGTETTRYLSASGKEELH